MGRLTLTFLFTLVSVFLIPVTTQANTEPFYKENTAYQWITQNYRFSHQVDYRFHSDIAGSFGANYRLSYSLGEYAVDLQAIFDRTNWDAIFPVTPGTPPTGPAVSENSQYNRPRNATDKWTLLTLESGLSYRGRLVPGTATKWIQSSRVSAGYVRLFEQASGLQFAGPSINFEASVWYQLLPKVLIGPTIGYRFGWGYLMGKPNLELDRIPFRQFQLNFGTVFRF
jgi:hypothetical protein